MSMVELNHVQKVYSKAQTPAVEDISLEIHEGEFIVFVGPSGCGKTTTLRMIAGLEEVSSGTIHIGGKDVTYLEPKDRNVAMVFQNYALYPTMTAYENIAFALKTVKVEGENGKLRHYNRKEVDEKVRAVADQLDLTRLLKRKPKQLSGGEKQRVALARALVRDPLIFLMDEPLSNLDAQLRIQTRSEIMNLHNKLNSVFIYVTHDQIEAMTMGDRIVVMNKGVVQQIGTPFEIFNNPANLFVASFIGAPSMNLFDAKLEKSADQWKVRFCPEYAVELNETCKERLDAGYHDGDPVIFGCRPEHTRLLRDDEDGMCIPVLLQEVTGAETILRGEFNGRKIAVTTKYDGQAVPEQMRIAADLEHMYLFDCVTGKNILY